MNENKKIRLLIISLVFILVLVIGGAYAWLTFTTGNIIVAGNTHCFNINYTKGADITGNIGAIKEEDYLTANTIKLSTLMGFTTISMELDKRCNKVSGIGTIELNINSLSNTYKSNGNSYGSLKYVVAEYNPSLYTDSTMQYLKNQTFNYIRRGIISEEGTIDIHTEYLNPGDKNNYLVIIYLDKNKVGDDIIGANVSATATARAEQFVETPLEDFYYILGSNQTEIENLTLNIEPLCISYETECEGYLVNYQLSTPIIIDENDILITSYKGTDPNVNIPNTYVVDNNTYNVKILSNTEYIMITDEDTGDEYEYDAGYGTFIYNNMIQNVKLGNNVVFLGYDPVSSQYINNVMNNTFSGCTLLENVPIIPNSVTSMKFTFSGCSSLVNAPVIPNSVTNMRETFSVCSSLVNAPVIPSSVTDMQSTFHNCSSLVNAPVIPSSVTDMQSTFFGCSSLVNVPVIPSSVTNMNYTFSYCTNLEGTIRINSSGITNATNTFANTSKNINIEVPSGSTTYNSFNGNVPGNVTLTTFGSE